VAVSDPRRGAMFARVTMVEASPDRIEGMTRYVREEILPAMQGQAGFKGMYHLVDRKSGRMLGITLWETEEACGPRRSWRGNGERPRWAGVRARSRPRRCTRSASRPSRPAPPQRRPACQPVARPVFLGTPRERKPRGQDRSQATWRRNHA
jgi:hypothetical protein